MVYTVVVEGFFAIEASLITKVRCTAEALSSLHRMWNSYICAESYGNWFVSMHGYNNLFVTITPLVADIHVPCILLYPILRWTLDLSCGPFKENCFSVTQTSWTSFASYCGGHAHHLYSQLMTLQYVASIIRTYFVNCYEKFWIIYKIIITLIVINNFV